MRLIRLTVLSALFLGLFAGIGQAKYQPEHDQSVSLTVAPELVQHDGSLGRKSFALQEGAHRRATKASGQSVDHFYVWVYVNGQPLLAVDPAWVEATE